MFNWDVNCCKQNKYLLSGSNAMSDVITQNTAIHWPAPQVHNTSQYVIHMQKWKLSSITNLRDMHIFMQLTVVYSCYFLYLYLPPQKSIQVYGKTTQLHPHCFIMQMECVSFASPLQRVYNSPLNAKEHGTIAASRCLHYLACRQASIRRNARHCHSLWSPIPSPSDRLCSSFHFWLTPLNF